MENKKQKTEKWFQQEKSDGKQPEMLKTWKSQIPERFSFKKNITEQLKDQKNLRFVSLKHLCCCLLAKKLQK
jgi:hypothetical protein